MNSHALGSRRGRTLQVWTPEDKAFWEQEGEAVAKLKDANGKVLYDVLVSGRVVTIGYATADQTQDLDALVLVGRTALANPAASIGILSSGTAAIVIAHRVCLVSIRTVISASRPRISGQGRAARVPTAAPVTSIDTAFTSA